MSQPRRRKKRPNFLHLKTVNIEQVSSKHGFGFRVSGEAPCYVNWVLRGSPAEAAGLKTDHFIMTVNGENVSTLSYLSVSELINKSEGRLQLNIAENDDDSDDQAPRQKLALKPRKNDRIKPASSSGRIDKVLADVHEGLFGDLISENAVLSSSQPSSKPVEPSTKHSGAHQPEHHRRAIRRSSIPETAILTSGLSVHDVEPIQMISQGASRVPPLSAHDMHEEFTHYPHSRTSGADFKVIRLLVGYLGSVELPAAVLLKDMLQIIRGCIRTLQNQKQVTKLILMEIDREEIRLINAKGETVVCYTKDKLTSCGVSPKRQTHFGIITSHCCVDSKPHVCNPDIHVHSNCCNIFMVDPGISKHSVHSKAAYRFNIDCTTDVNTEVCMEFPLTAQPIVKELKRLCRSQSSSHFGDDGAIPDHIRSQSTSSNSDSGIGYCREEPCPTCNENVLVLDTRKNQPAGKLYLDSTDVCMHVSSSIKPQRPQHFDDDNRNLLTREPGSGSSLCTSPTSSLGSRDSRDTKNSVDKFAYPQSKPPRPMGGVSSYMKKRRNSGDSGSSSSGFNLPKRYNAKNSLQGASAMAPYISRLQHQNTDPESYKESCGESSMSEGRRSPVRPQRGLNMGGFTQNSQLEIVELSSGSGDMCCMTCNCTEGMAVSMCPCCNDVTILDDFPQYNNIDYSSTAQASGQYLPVLPNKHLPAVDHMNSQDSTQSPRELETYRGAHTLGGTPLARTRGLSVSHERPVSACNSTTFLIPEEHSTENGKVISISSGPATCVSLSGSITSLNDHGSSKNTTEVTRVTGWAVDFEKLINDPVGVKSFTVFLRSEWSEENIVFWTSCEELKTLSDPEQISILALKIFNNHLADNADHMVNIPDESRKKAAEALEEPHPQMFSSQQQQIYLLMKHDCYPRFVKSELYRACLHAEFDGKPLPFNDTGNNADFEVVKNFQKKLCIEIPSSTDSSISEDRFDCKKRRSLLPWNRKKRKPVLIGEKDARKMKKGIGRLSDDSESGQSSRSSMTSGDVNSINSSKITKSASESMGSTDEKFCRVLLPDGSYTVINTDQDTTIYEAFTEVCIRRGLPIAAIDLHHTGSAEGIDLHQDVKVLACTEVVIERKALFKIELPNCRVIIVKSKPNKPIIDVFKPVLHKYGLSVDNLVVRLSGDRHPLDVNMAVAMLDQQMVIIETVEQYAKFQQKETMKAALGRARKAKTYEPSEDSEDHDYSDGRVGDTDSWDRMMSHNNVPPKVDDASMFTRLPFQAGPADSMNDCASMVPQLQQPVAPSTGVNMSANTTESNINKRAPQREQEEFFDLLAKIQSNRMDDQRGVLPRRQELPEFLRPVSSMPSSSSKSSDTSNTSTSDSLLCSGSISNSYFMPHMSINTQLNISPTDPALVEAVQKNPPQLITFKEPETTHAATSFNNRPPDLKRTVSVPAQHGRNGEQVVTEPTGASSKARLNNISNNNNSSVSNGARLHPLLMSQLSNHIPLRTLTYNHSNHGDDPVAAATLDCYHGDTGHVLTPEILLNQASKLKSTSNNRWLQYRNTHRVSAPVIDTQPLAGGGSTTADSLASPSEQNIGRTIEELTQLFDNDGGRSRAAIYYTSPAAASNITDASQINVFNV